MPCGHAGWERVEYGIASPPPHWRLTLRADAARLANRPYHFAAQSALNEAVGRFPPPGPPPSSPAALGIPAKGWPWRRGAEDHWAHVKKAPPVGADGALIYSRQKEDYLLRRREQRLASASRERVDVVGSGVGAATPLKVPTS